MIITRNTSQSNAVLRLALMHSLDGELIHEGVSWRLIPKLASMASIHIPEAIACVTVAPGEYSLSLTYQEEALELGSLSLSSFTETDAVFVLPEVLVTEANEYYVDYDQALGFACRSQERELQTAHGFATLPLRDPQLRIQGEQSMTLKSHPLLRDAVQFDGVPPEIRPDPSQNKEALQLTLTQRLQAQATPLITPSMTPNRG
jgi:hypothetical protein